MTTFASDEEYVELVQNPGFGALSQSSQVQVAANDGSRKASTENGGSVSPRDSEILTKIEKNIWKSVLSEGLS